MELQDEVLTALLQAVEVSPESPALRRHYAEVLLNRGFTKEAEAQFRRALDLDGSDMVAKLGLARALQSQGLVSSALLLTRQVIRESNRPARAYVLYARLLLACGSIKEAAEEYYKAVDADPATVDPDLATRLGVPGGEDGSVPAPAAPAVSEPPAEPQPPLEETVRQLFASRPALGFQQVGGLALAKAQLEESLVLPSRRPKAKPLGGRFLLYGPPGCGKKHLARALAGELLVPFLSISLRDLQAVWHGESRLALAEICDQARRHRAVLVVEEVEQTVEEPVLVKQLVKELEHHSQAASPYTLILTADEPWSVLPALTAERLYQRTVFVPPPSTSARAEILKILAQGKPQNFLSFRKVAEAAEGFCASDLRSLVETAIRLRLQHSLELGRPMPLTTEGLLEAAATISPSIPTWTAQAREHLPLLDGFPDLIRSLETRP